MQDWLETLPDHLLRGILQLSWSLDKRRRTPAEEVRCALQLRSVCQRVSRQLRALPLPLHLDFSWPPGPSVALQQKHVRWMASAAQKDSVASLTLPGWDMSRQQQHSAAVVLPRLPDSVPDLQLVQALAGNQRQSLRRLHGIWAVPIWSDNAQVDLSAFALTHVGLMLGYWSQDFCAAALPVTLESLACCKAWSDIEPVAWDMGALLRNIGSLPCLARIHMRCQNIFLPQRTALWRGKHVVLTAERDVLLHFRESPEGGPGVFGAAASVRIEAGTIKFMFLDMERFRALAYMLCRDTLGEAVLEAGIQRGVEFIGQPLPIPPAMDWKQVLHALIVERGDLFAFEVETRLGRIRLAWRRWPPCGTHAHKAAAELHRQAADWAGVNLACQPALL